MIAAIPERNIYLYGIKPSGVILYIDGEGHYYDWDYHSTRFTLPKIALNDFDHDGDEEISVILQLNNEDGFAEEELHIIEITNDDDADDEIFIDLASENAKYCVYDHCFSFTNCIRDIKEHVQIKTFYEAGILMAEVNLYDTVYYVNLRQLQLLDPNIEMDTGERIGNIVHFNTFHDRIIAQLSLGIISKSYKTPLLIGNLSLEVLYNGKGFGYTNVEFVSRNGLFTQKTLTKE